MNRIFSFIVSDYPRKLLALVFAVMLYIGVSRQIFVERNIPSVPVEVKLAPELSFIAKPHYQVTLTVRGAERALQKLNPEDFSGAVYVGPENRVSDDVYLVHMRADMFKQKPGVKIVNEPVLKLNLQRRISKRVQVKAQFSGRLSDEYHCSDVRCIPAEVVVSGPELMLKSLDTVFTEPIPLAETVTDPFEYESRLAVPADLQFATTKVMVQVEIIKSFEQRRIGGLPVRLMQDGSDKLKAVTAEPAQSADVTLSGLSTRLAALKPGDIRLFADLSDIRKPGIYTVPLRSSCAVEGVSVKAVTPGEIKVKVIKLP